MSFFETRDGTRLFYADWTSNQAARSGSPVVFLTGWGLSTTFWAKQMLDLSARGVRCVAYDRRGHGRSDDPGRGYDADTLADDLADLMTHLDLRGATLVGHSMGGNEVVRYLTRHGEGRVARIVFLGTSLPFLLKTEDNPEGVDPSVFAQARAAWRHDYAKWLSDNARPFVTESTSQETIDWLKGLMLQASMKALMDCAQVNSGIDFRPELAKIRVPALFVHGTADASNPIELTAGRAVKHLPGSQLLIYDGAPHGLPITHAERFNEDLLAFIGK